MTIPVGFVTRLAIPLITVSLLFNENYGPEQVILYDKILRASDVALSRARGEGEGPTETFDYIIIGGGSAGAVLANRLSESGNNRVLLLDAGGDPNPLSDIPIAKKHIFSSSDLFRLYPSVPQEKACLDTKGCSTPRGITLGGCTVINSAVYNRCNRNDYDRWAEFTRDSVWSFESVLKAFKKIENYHGFYADNPGPNHGTDGEVYIGKFDYLPGSDFLLDALAEDGIPTVDFNSGLTPFGFSKIDYNIKEGLRQSSYTAFINPVLDRPNLTIYRYATATKIHLDEYKKAVGVTYSRHNETRYVNAGKEIIVSAGVFESPKLLMLSGIGPAEHLNVHGIPSVVDLPAVGNYLQDHVGSGGDGSYYLSVNKTFGRLDHFSNEALLQYVENGTGPLNAIELNYPQIVMGYLPSRTWRDFSWPDIQTYISEQVVPTPGGKVEQKLHIVLGLMRPESYGTIRLASSNPEDKPLIDFNFFDVPTDLERLVDGIEIMTRIMLNNAKLQSIGIKWGDDVKKHKQCERLRFGSRDYWKCLVRQASSTHWHPTSSCRMGPDSTQAVVDSKLRVFGTNGLRVVDASVMPFVTSGNTNFPTMMIGQMASEMILNGGYYKSNSDG